MGIGVSIFLIALGAILTFAVTAEANGLDVQVVGVILMCVGIAGLLLSLIFWESFWGRPGYRRGAYAEPVDHAARSGWYARGYRPAPRQRVVEEVVDDVPAAPGPPPPDAPPPPPPP